MSTRQEAEEEGDKKLRPQAGGKGAKQEHGRWGEAQDDGEGRRTTTGMIRRRGKTSHRGAYPKRGRRDGKGQSQAEDQNGWPWRGCD